MLKIIILLILLTFSIFAKSFNFTEIRYSDAIEKNIEQKGQITFFSNGIDIYYPETYKNLIYKDNNLVYEVDGEDKELGGIQEQKIIYYLDLLILLHSGDDNVISNIFKISKYEKYMVLLPKNEMKNYIDKIELSRDNGLLKYFKLYLSNNDSITITIDNEIF